MLFRCLSVDHHINILFLVSVGRGEKLPSFSQLDGQDDAISSNLASGVSSYVEKEEEEEDFPEVLREASSVWNWNFSIHQS